MIIEVMTKGDRHAVAVIAFDPKLVEQMVGRLAGEAELAIQRIRRAVRDKVRNKDTPKTVRVDAEHRCYQIFSDLVGSMQRLGYLSAWQSGCLSRS